MKKLSRAQLTELILVHVDQPKKLDNVIAMVAAHLIETKRNKEVQLLVRDIATVAAKRYGHTLARVSTAQPLDARVVKAIEKLVSTLEHATTVEIDHTIDPSLLGGAVIQTPEREIDVSARGRLNQITSLGTNAKGNS